MVIAGGGVIGVSVAFHLAEAGVDVLLCERGELGSGSSSRGAGGVRTMFSDELNVRICQRSLEAWRDFARRPGGELDLHEVGYLFLLTSPEEVEAFERSIELMHAVGAPAELLDPEQAARLSPLASMDGVLAAALDPGAGHATPEGAVQGYAAAARALGARLHLHREITAIETGSRRTAGDAAAAGPGARSIVRVETSRGPIETETVICCTGAWSASFGALAGVELPVTPQRRRIAYTAPLEGLPDELPMTIDFNSGFYFHREGPGLLFGANADAEGEAAWLEAVAPQIAHRAPILVDAPIAGGWSGLYELTPDHNALIGEAASPGRFLYATGFSGHGFQQAPAVGEIVRDLYLGSEPFVDVAPLAAGRAMRPEHNVV